MKTTNMKKMAVVGAEALAIAILALLPACKGRTMENMEPTGDTVEVNIDRPEETAPVTTLSAPVTTMAAPDSI